MVEINAQHPIQVASEWRLFLRKKIRLDVKWLLLSNIEGKNACNVTSTPHVPFFPHRKKSFFLKWLELSTKKDKGQVNFRLTRWKLMEILSVFSLDCEVYSYVYFINLNVFILIETFSAYVTLLLLHVISFCCLLRTDSLFKELFILRFFTLSPRCVWNLLVIQGYRQRWTGFETAII